jgi:hypothetical protein
MFFDDDANTMFVGQSALKKGAVSECKGNNPCDTFQQKDHEYISRVES